MSTAEQLNTLPGQGSFTDLYKAQVGTVTFVPPEGTPKVTGKLAEALANAQKDFKSVNKSKTGKIKGTTKEGRPYEYEYKYADLSDIFDMAIPALSKQGIAFSQPLRRDGDKLYVVTRIQMGDEFLEDAGLPVPTQVKPQELGTYLTYYRRYGVSTFLGIAADEDTDGPQEGKQYTSGQNLVQSARAASNPAPLAANMAKRGRPANLPVTKATEVVPPTPVENAGPQIANDNDVPEIIGDKPSPEERKEFLARLKKFIEVTGVDAMKKYMGGDTNLTKIAWTNLLAKLDSAQSEGKLKELVN